MKAFNLLMLRHVNKKKIGSEGLPREPMTPKKTREKRDREKNRKRKKEGE